MYIGNDLQIAHPSYKIIDDISSGFNGSTTSFALQVSGETPVPFPISTQQVMISVNGVVQEPDPSGSAGFKLLGSNIVFSSAPANGHAFFGVINAGADYVTAGSEFPDGSATAPSFTFESDLDTGWYRSSAGAVSFTSNGVQKVIFDGNGLNVVGTITDDGATHDGDVTFLGASSNGLWDKSANAFVANVTGNLTGTASIATTVTVADESSDTTCFPLFATAATGDLAPKSGTNLTFNSNTGALTATSFVGDLTGDVTGDVTGNCSGTSGGFTAGNAGNLNAGTVGTARLGSGTASSSTFLRGDGSWATAGGLSSDAQGNTVGGTNAGDSFTGTDATKNTLLGYDAGTAITTGDWNVALGHSALKAATVAGANIAIGYEAGTNLSTASGNVLIGQLAAKNGVLTGAYNVSVGYSTGYQLTSGHTNTFLGSQAGYGTTTGYENTYIGQDAGGGWEGTGNNNIAVGHACMQGAAVTGSNNIGIGQSAFNALTSGTLNIAIGYQACLLQATGSDSVAIGYQALNNATSGENIGIGRLAGKGVTTGTDNIAIGRYAVYGSALTGTGNIGIGRHAFRYGTAASANNVCIGRESGGYTGTQYISEGSNNICIGYQADVSTQTTSNEVTIGNSSITKFRIPGISVTMEASGISDAKGNLRSIPQNTQGSTYTLVAADAGKHIFASGTVTVPDSIFSAGDAVTIVNNTGSNLTITKSITTMYNAADGTSANRTLANRGMATILFVSGTVAYISGAGLS